MSNATSNERRVRMSSDEDKDRRPILAFFCDSLLPSFSNFLRLRSARCDRYHLSFLSWVYFGSLRNRAGGEKEPLKKCVIASEDDIHRAILVLLTKDGENVFPRVVCKNSLNVLTCSLLSPTSNQCKRLTGIAQYHLLWSFKTVTTVGIRFLELYRVVDIADPTCAVSQTNRIATSCPLPPLCGFVIRRVDNTVSELMLKTDVDMQSTLKAANYKSLSMLTKSTLQFLGCEVNQLSTRQPQRLKQQAESQVLPCRFTLMSDI
ncbi:hypothetical protein F2P81_005286 [Scophthalmus maximus]|uniref:Uncharacterized protein n=1 Tax=Scophthalmus maximus TaxID=52904 RepID=A0A6A4TEV4_SCOMX|nr:hypothetical protein F2P81_005286 [Scophthalmus maximus]